MNMTANERADAIIQDILTNHLPRIKEGLEKGYVDENQILIMFDHAVRARVLKEHTGRISYHPLTGMPYYEDNLDRVNKSLESEAQLDAAIDEAIAALPARIDGQERDAWIRANMQHPLWRAAFKREQEVRGRNKEAVMLDEANFRFEHPKEKEQNREAMFGKQHVEKLACVCGGIIHDLPTSVEALLKCEQCDRVFMDEFELAEVRRKEFSSPLKQPDATYFTTGTLAGGTTPVPLETEINLNGQKTRIRANGGQFILTYERIVRMAVNQMLKQKSSEPTTMTDAELPSLSVTYHHRVPFQNLPGERSGTLCRGQQVAVSTGMSINAVDTSNA